MNRLSNWLQNNPIIVLVMFVVSLSSGVVGIALGWKQFYREYLSLSLEVPIWLLILALIFLPIFIVAFRSAEQRTRPIKEEKVERCKFGVQRVILDGKRFDNCVFEGTELVFEGRTAFSLSNCSLSNTRFTVDNHAALTLGVFTALYADPGLRRIVEGTIENIRKGSHPEAIQPYNLNL